MPIPLNSASKSTRKSPVKRSESARNSYRSLCNSIGNYAQYIVESIALWQRSNHPQFFW